MAVALVAFTACQKKAEQKTENAETVNEEIVNDETVDEEIVNVAPTVYSADQVLEQAANLVDQTILVQGKCIHLCKHSGKKAFLQNDKDENSFVLCLLGEDDEPFATECLNSNIRVKGVVRAFEVEQPTEEHQHAEGEEACGVCSSVKAYYIETLSYDIVAE